MAAARGSTAKPRRRKPGSIASTLMSALVGVVVGLAVAVGVAFYMNKAATPFVDKVKRPIEVPKADEMPDPNRPLARARPAAPETAAAPAPTPAAAPPEPAAPAAPPSATEPAGAEAASFVLQVGAFRGQEDADAMKAKLALMGIEAHIGAAEVNGMAFYRVRVGPYANTDEMSAARNRLAESGIEASVVRQR